MNGRQNVAIGAPTSALDLKGERTSMEKEAAVRTRVALSGEKVGKARAQLLRLQAELDDESHDCALGIGDAAERAKVLTAHLAEQERLVSSLAAEHAKALQELNALEAARLVREEEQRFRSIPERRADVMASVANVERDALALRQSIQNFFDTSKAFAAVSDISDSRRALGLGALRDLLRHCLFNTFLFGRTDAGSGQDIRSNVQPFHIFDWAVNPASPLVKISLATAVEKTFDNLDLVYSSEADACQAQGRIDPPNGPSTIVLSGRFGLWMIVKRGIARGASRVAGKGASS